MCGVATKAENYYIFGAIIQIGFLDAILSLK